MKTTIKIPDIKPQEKIIVVVGLPASGKSTVTDGLMAKYKTRSPKLYRTDDYIKYEFKESLYVMLRDLKRDLSPFKIIEGVQGYRLLRKGLQLKSFNPDLVIVCIADKATRQARFIARDAKATGTGKKRHGGFDGMLNKIWGDYMMLLAEREPTTTAPRFLILNTVTGEQKNA